MTICEVDWPSVIIGAVVIYIVAWVWYLPNVMGNALARAESGRIYEDPSRKPHKIAYLTEAGYALLLSWFVALLFGLQFDRLVLIGIGPIFGLLVILAILNSGLWQTRRLRAIAIDVGCFVISIALLLGIQFWVRQL